MIHSDHKHMRDGQWLFNFLEWLADIKGLPTEQSHRMADVFHVDDEQLKAYQKEYTQWLQQVAPEPKNE